MYSQEDFQHDITQLQEHVFNFYRSEPVALTFRHPKFKEYPKIQRAPCSLQDLLRYQKERILPHTTENNRTIYYIHTDDAVFWAPFILAHIWQITHDDFSREKNTLQKALKHIPITILEYTANTELYRYAKDMNIDFERVITSSEYPKTRQLLLTYKMKECLPYLPLMRSELLASDNGELWNTLINVNKSDFTSHKTLLNNLYIFYVWKQQLLAHGIPHANHFFDSLYERLQKKEPIDSQEEFSILHPYYPYPFKHREEFQYLYLHIELWHAFIHQRSFGPAVIWLWCDRNTNITLMPEQREAFETWWKECSDNEQQYWKRYVLTYMTIKKIRREQYSLLQTLGISLRKNHFLTDIQPYLQAYNVNPCVDKALQHADNLITLGHLFHSKRELMLQYCIEQIAVPLHEEHLYL